MLTNNNPRDTLVDHSFQLVSNEHIRCIFNPALKHFVKQVCLEGILKLKIEIKNHFSHYSIDMFMHRLFI